MDWIQLRNPVLDYPEWSIKDACLAYRNGLWHVFFSAFDQERSHVAMVTTPDFKDFSDFQFRLSGEAMGCVGLCSPDIVYANGQYVLVFNSWGENPEQQNAMYTMSSSDLSNWSEVKPLAHDLAPEARIIDGALAWTGVRWYCICKVWKKPQLAWSSSLEGPWQWVGQETVQLLAEDGADNGLFHENFQFIQIDGRWHLLSTDYGVRQLQEPEVKKGKRVLGHGHSPWIYESSGNPDDPASWLTWEKGRPLNVPHEEFNDIDRINAASVHDHRSEDGYFYMIYGGKNANRRDEFAGTAAHGRPWPRGWNRLGIARSRDLLTFDLPGAIK